MHNPLSKFVFCTFFGQRRGGGRYELCMGPFSLVLWVVPAVPSSPSPAVQPAWPWSHPHQGQPSPAQHTSTQSIWHVTKYHTVTSMCHKIPHSHFHVTKCYSVNFTIVMKCHSFSHHKMPQSTLHVIEQADQRNDCKTQELFKYEFPFFSNKMFRTTGETEGLLLMYSNSYKIQKPWMFCFRTKTV